MRISTLIAAVEDKTINAARAAKATAKDVTRAVRIEYGARVVARAQQRIVKYNKIIVGMSDNEYAQHLLDIEAVEDRAREILANRK